ncbi:MAG: cation transporter [Bacteroidales bacterium]|nr:cation transporter [Bacteroidales bacterium]
MKLLKGSREKEYWLLASVFLNIFFSVTKLFWGWHFSSTVVLVDGIHSISDVFGAFLIFMALRISGRKSRLFPFGLNKLEDMAAILGGLAIVFAGYEIIRNAFFGHGIKSPSNILGTFLFILGIIILESLFYFFERKAARRLESPGVKADAANWLGDIGTSFVVLAGIVGYYFSIPYAEKVAVVLIVVMILYSAFGILRDAVLTLLDASVDLETIRKARQIIRHFTEVSRIEKLYIRRSGSMLIADIVLQVNQKSMEKAHLLIDKIEQSLYREIPNLDTVTIHYEPGQKSFTTLAVLLDDTKKNIATSFYKTEWIEIKQISAEGKLLHSNMVSNPVNNLPKGKAIRLAAWLIEQKIDKLIFDPEDMEDDLKTLFTALGIEILNSHQFVSL